MGVVEGVGSESVRGKGREGWVVRRMGMRLLEGGGGLEALDAMVAGKSSGWEVGLDAGAMVSEVR